MVRSLILTACVVVTTLTAASGEPECTAFTDATVLNPRVGVVRHATVVACGERIDYVGPTTHARASPHTRAIDARNAF
jgi:hypothetical protein